MDVKARLQDEVDACRDDLIALSHRIHAHPELKFEEEQASTWIAEALADGGFEVDRGVCELPTAFTATAGSGPLAIGICAEYDALPGIGHACGHNIIAASAVGAGLALARVADDLGVTVRVLGTPAEEGGGGKIFMLERGAFDGLHAAMMIHPSAANSPVMDCLAVQPLHVRYRGRSAHASAHPQRGLNAADALTVAQVAIGLLRQHIEPTDRVHGIVTDGGDAPNIVPERTAGNWYVRSATLERMEHVLRPRVERCFEAGALATGCEVEIEPDGPAYSELDPDPDLTAAFVRNAEALGRSFPSDGSGTTTGSTDMGNVSLALPSIHPMLAVESDGAVIHQPAFAAAAVSPSGDRAVRDGALAMAWTVADAVADDEVRDRLVATPYRRG